jgi:lipoprotein signal peptidase
MTMLVPSVGENMLLGMALGFNAQEDFLLKLFVNNVTPADTDVASTYTEMSTLGYTAKTLSKGNWTITQNGGVAQGSFAQQTWTFSAGAAVTVYGYYVVGAASGTLLFSELFGSAKVVQNAGDTIKITPQITLSKV